MKKRKKETKPKWYDFYFSKSFPIPIKELILVIVIATFAVLMLPQESMAKECSYSKYNTYSNSTNGYNYFLGRCYVKVTMVYESTKECGFLGISCYETEPRTKMDYRTVCFKLKNGERC